MNTEQLLQAMQAESTYPHPVQSIKMLETHISWVFLTGDKAYKLKKPVNFGFLDYSELEQRKAFCEKELALNARLAKEIYHRVVTLNKGPNGIQIDGEGDVVEYAIEMSEFSQDGLLDKGINEGKVDKVVMENLAVQIANFHLDAEVAAHDTPFGLPETVYAPVHENFEQARPLLNEATDLTLLEELAAWAKDTHQKLTPEFEKRKRDKKIKACHGDIHLGNITFYQDKTVIFDCIEFNEYFRWTDTMAEVGFLLMDLFDHGREDLASIFLNKYMELTGDYHGLTVLPFYIAYRAMVRAKIQLFNMSNNNEDAVKALLKQYRQYAEIAHKVAEKKHAHLYLTYGLSGSGKSTVAKLLVKENAVICIRSDVERKRLFTHVEDESGEGVNKGLYRSDKTKQTYSHLAKLAKMILNAGYSVVVDAACLYQWQRNILTEVSKDLELSYTIIETTGSLQFLEEMITKRQSEKDNVSDATVEVLHHQQKAQEELTTLEQLHAITINMEQFVENNNDEELNKCLLSLLQKNQQTMVI